MKRTALMVFSIAAAAALAAMPAQAFQLPHIVLPKPAPAPPPAPRIATPMFYFEDNGKPSAPLTLQEIEAKIASGAIKPDTLVWRTGLPSWIPARKLAEIAPFFASSDAPLKTFLVGEWDASQPGGKGPTAATFIVSADGTMTGDVVVKSSTLPMTGTWVARETADKRFDWTVTMVINVPGQPKPRIATDTAHLEIVDHDTLHDTEDGTIIKRVGGK